MRFIEIEYPKLKIHKLEWTFYNVTLASYKDEKYICLLYSEDPNKIRIILILNIKVNDIVCKYIGF